MKLYPRHSKRDPKMEASFHKNFLKSSESPILTVKHASQFKVFNRVYNARVFNFCFVFVFFFNLVDSIYKRRDAANASRRKSDEIPEGSFS